MTISLPEKHASQFVETTYRFEEGFQPEAPEWYETVRSGRTQRTFIISEITITESTDPADNYHSISVRGRPILKSSKKGHFGRATYVTLSPEQDLALWQQHLDRSGRSHYNVFILSVEPIQKIRTIKNIRSLTQLDLKGAVDLVNNSAHSPQPLWAVPVKYNVAVEAKALLNRDGATVEIRRA